LDPRYWFLIIGVLLTVVVVFAVARHRRGELPLVPLSAFGRGQLLFLLLLWVPILAAFMQAFATLKQRGPLLVHVTFWLTGIACTFLVLMLPEKPAPIAWKMAGPEDRSWRPGWVQGVVWALMPGLILLLAWLSVRSHEGPLPGSHLRFQ